MDEQILQVLKEILIWTKASSYSEVDTLLRNALQDRRHKLAYQEMDGSHTVESVKKAAGLGYKAISDLCQRCSSMGLMEKRAGKFVRLFDLNDFGLLSLDQTDNAGNQVVAND